MLYFTAMRNTKYILIAFLIISLMAGTAISLQASTACDASNITNKPEAELKEYLQKCEEEAAKAQAVLNQTKTEVRSIDGVVKTLQTKITSAEKTIKNKNSLIVELGSEIRTRQARIEELEADIARGKESLAELIRRTNEVGDYTLAEVFLNTKNLSEFYVDIDNYTGIKAELELYFSQIRETQLQTEGEKTQLSEKQNDELDAKYIIEQEKKRIASDQLDQKRLLSAKQSTAKVQEATLAEIQKKAAAIRAELFKLRDAGAIPFEDALKYAQTAERATGVRAAFILGILRQESNLGSNVGRCYLADEEGNGRYISTGGYVDGLMREDAVRQDATAFLALVKKLGRDPYATPVSCPISSTTYGGAMGPTQFIPTTWKGIEASLMTALGVSATDPWNPQHAIMATAVYVQRLGAAKQTYTAEREAAARYYAGGNWATMGLSYAASVLNHAEGFQKNIDFLDQN